MGDKEYHEEHKDNETSSGINVIFYFLKLAFIIIILALFILGILYAAGYLNKEGYLGSKFRVIFEPIITVFKGIGGFFFGQAMYAYEVSQNPELISLSGGYKEPEKKTGLNLEDIEIVRGLSYGLLTDDLVFSTNIIVNQFPEEVERFDILVECSLDDISGKVSVGIGDEEEKKIIEVTPPREDENSRKKYVQCSIPKEDIDKDLKDFNTKTARFEITYRRDNQYNSAERVFLNVFIIPKEAYLGTGKYEKYGSLKGDEAFINLGKGDDNKIRNPIVSKMRYRGDVEARMSFSEQPLVIGEKADFFFMFQNNLRGMGNVSIRGFKVNFPQNIILDDCKYLDSSGAFIDGFDEANKMLNDIGKSPGYDCPVHVYKSEQVGELIKMDDPTMGLNAEFEYALRISKEKTLQINKKTEQ